MVVIGMSARGKKWVPGSLDCGYYKLAYLSNSGITSGGQDLFSSLNLLDMLSLNPNPNHKLFNNKCHALTLAAWFGRHWFYGALATA